MHPFNLTCINLKHDNDQIQGYIKRITNILENEMSNYTLCKQFITALEYMCHPNLKFKDAYGEISNLISNKNLSSKAKRLQLIDIMEDMQQNMFSLKNSLIDRKIGKQNRKFCQEFYKKFNQIIGKNGKNYKSSTKKVALIFMSHESAIVLFM